jgi:hypothetical protein
MVQQGKANPQQLDYPGDYNLQAISILPDFEKAIDIKDMVQELNIYESIYKGALTGNLVLVDGANLIENHQLQGTERLDFKLGTPGTSGESAVDASEETGHPFHIYKISNRKQLNDGTMSYMLHFCSRSFLRNIRTRVSQAYYGDMHESVVKIYTDKLGFDGRKKLIYEPTGNIDKIVIPNLRPLDAISLIGSKSLSKNTGAPGYLFYETTKAHHFRSYSSLFAIQGTTPRNSAVRLRYSPKWVGTKQRDDDNLFGVTDYSFNQHFDTAGQQAMGTYAQRVITHNIFDKSYDVYDWDYHTWYEYQRHADSGKTKYPITPDPVDTDLKDDGLGHKGVSEYPESKILLQGTTQYLHNEDKGAFGIDVSMDGHGTALLEAQTNQLVNGSQLKITMPGHSYLQVGDVIDFDLPSLEPKKQQGKGFAFNPDDYHSGRYLIVNMRHKVVKEQYTLILDCVKDSVWTPYESTGDIWFEGKIKERPELVDLYEDIDQYEIMDNLSAE